MHRPKPQDLWTVVRETVANDSQHDATPHSAAIAELVRSFFRQGVR